MRKSLKAGFTLVEILIVVVILGILAAIVVPQFTNASSEAVKGALQSQLQTISSQVELYRVKNQGALPHEDATDAMLGATNDGWGIMVSEDYLKEPPVNGYTGEALVDSGDADAALAGDRESAEGWFYDEATGTVFAVAYDPVNKLLAHEEGYDAGEDPAP